MRETSYHQQDNSVREGHLEREDLGAAVLGPVFLDIKASGNAALDRQNLTREGNVHQSHIRGKRPDENFKKSLVWNRVCGIERNEGAPGLLGTRTTLATHCPELAPVGTEGVS